LVVYGASEPDISTELNLGLDSQGNQGGIVQFGWDETAGPLNGSTLIPKAVGLAVVGGGNCSGCSTIGQGVVGPVAVTDFGGPADQVLRVFNHTDSSTQWLFGVQLGTGVISNLTHNPIVKGGRADGGFGGVVGIGNGGILHLKGATVANQTVAGVFAASGITTLESCTVSDNGCFGVLVGALTSETNGTSGQSLFYNNTFFQRVSGGDAILYASQSTITRNFLGVVQDGSDQSGNGRQGLITDLRYGPDGGPGGNEVSCNDRSHGFSDPLIACQAYESGGPGTDVWNRSSFAMYADNVAWAPQVPGLWTCDNVLTPQSCFTDGGTYCQAGGGCLTTPLPATFTVDGAGAGLISVGSGTLSSTVCP
jgi:hypothetical protein